jgi:type I restriction enzyme R subunit
MELTEAQTRARLIDTRLALAGWNVKDRGQVIEELEILLRDTRVAERPAESPSLDSCFSDYGLLLHGKPAAVIEAKRTSRDAELGQEQALQYAQHLERHHGVELPFVLYTNGRRHFFWESDLYPPEEVVGFPTRDDLEWMRLRRRQRRALSVELINRDIAGRDYQIQGIRTLLEGIEQKRRKFLMVMATGTGKTRAAVALVDVLQRAGWAKRVLFLVDRIPLRRQALDAFKEYLPSEPRWPEKGDRGFPRERRVYVATYPTMLNLIESSRAPETYISPFFFDIVIADESHRSLYNVYKSVLDYFSAIKIGLTATPTDFVDHDTFELFDCADGDPTFAYSFEEAIAHVPPYLCNFEVLKVRSKFQLEGIHGGALAPAEQRRLIAEGKDLEAIDFDGTELERKVTNSGTNGLVVREFMEESIKDPSGTLPGKTILFAISIDHARRLQRLFDGFYPEHKGRLARVLVSEDSRVHDKGGLLDQFKLEDMPRVAISVDMLDTGVDIREVVNLVFAKPVYSRVKFWQMIGRGTRVLEEPPKRKPWCPEKDRFLIIDCWGNFAYFDMHPEGRDPQTLVAAPVRLFRARLDKLDAALTVGQLAVAEAACDDLRSDLAKLPERNLVVQQASAELARVRDSQFWRRIDGNKVAFLRTAIAPILRARTGDDLKSLRFEIDAVEYATARLAGERERSDAIRESLRAQVDELPTSVNLVARERDLIESVLGDEWWVDPPDDAFRSMTQRLAPLMPYRTPKTTALMKLDLRDLTVIKERIDLGGDLGRLSIAAYRERIEAFVRDLVDENPVLQRVRDGAELTKDEIHDLAALLESSDLHVTEARLQQVYDNRTAHFLSLIRHVLGLERVASWEETVTARFDAFIAAHTDLTSRQILFLQTLRTFILQTRRVEKQDLVDEPFTRVHPSGIQGLFDDVEIEEILVLARDLVETARGRQADTRNA